MIETSSGLPRKSSVLFYNLGNLRLSSEIFNFGNLREVVANLRKVVKNAVNKYALTREMSYMF